MLHLKKTQFLQYFQPYSLQRSLLQKAVKNAVNFSGSKVDDLEFWEFYSEIFAQETAMTHFRSNFRAEKNAAIQILGLHTLNDVSSLDQLVEFHNILIPRDFLVLESIEEPSFGSPISLVFIFDAFQTQQKRKISFVGVITVTVPILQTDIENLLNVVVLQNGEKFLRRFLGVANGKQLHVYDPFFVPGGTMPRVIEDVEYPVMEIREKSPFSRFPANTGKSDFPNAYIVFPVTARNFDGKGQITKRGIFPDRYVPVCVNVTGCRNGGGKEDHQIAFTSKKARPGTSRAEEHI